MAAHRTKRIDQDTVEYRGWSIRRSTTVPQGYYGRYIIPGQRSFSSLKDAKDYVDSKLDRKADAAKKPIDYEQVAEAHGAKFDRADNGLWRLLDQPATVLWLAYFLDRPTAACAYCMQHKLANFAS